MTEDLVSGEAWLKPGHTSSSFEGWGGRTSEALSVEAITDWRPKAEILRASPQVIFAFGALDTLPAPILKGVWYQIAYQLGATANELALEISKFDTSELATARGSERASVTCLVHERWLADFDASMEGGSGELRLGIFHLPSELRAIAAKAFHYELSGAARVAYRTAKGLELLCETAQLSLRGKLIALQAGSGLSASDMQRLFSAKRTIAEQFEKKLTLDSIGRACGLNRAKLTRGFKTVFGTSIAEALSEERLLRASVLLQTTNKPVSNIGYEAGYLNNASFTRAFARRFGVCPSEYRLRQLSRETVAA
ncbi:MAG TPA: AraC family transcriptional regulator [Rhizomicrobium sp.]|jgi:AraC family transcriptional activator of pyochelin receptor